MADHPFHIFEFKRAVRIGLAEIRQNGFVRAVGNGWANHLVMRGVFPTLVIALMAGRAFRRAYELRLVSVRQSFFLSARSAVRS